MILMKCTCQHFKYSTQFLVVLVVVVAAVGNGDSVGDDDGGCQMPTA